MPPPADVPDLQSLFLRACLHEGAAAREAWERWAAAATSGGAPVRRALVPVNEFLPLLAWNLGRAGAALEPSLQTHLRSAHLTEDLRWRNYCAIRDAAFALLGAGHVPFIALKGAVIGELDYPDPVFRHAHDIDVLLHEHDLPRATEAFLHAGWRQRKATVLPNPRHAPPLVHPRGVAIELHHRIAIPYHTVPYDRLWHRSGTARIGGRGVRVLSAPDRLLHACVHGVAGRERRWMVDAWFILTRHHPFDWTTFVATTIAARLDLPMFAALGELARGIQAPVPDAVLCDLGARAARAPYAARAAARQWPVPAPPGASLAARVRSAARRAFPPPLQFALHYGVPLSRVPLAYLVRLWRYARASLTAGGAPAASSSMSSPTSAGSDDTSGPSSSQ